NDGTLSDLRVSFDGRTFQPCFRGGIRFEVNEEILRPGDREEMPRFVREERDGEKRVYHWEWDVDGVTLRYRYEIAVRDKSCIVDVATEGGHAVQLDIGLAKGMDEPKTAYFPYLTYGEDWPKVVCGRGDTGPVFLLAL